MTDSLNPTLASPRLRRLAQRPAEGPAADSQRCELCAEPISSCHRHLLDLESRALLCACRACSLLFDRRAAGGGHYRLVPERRVRLDQFELSELAWEQLRIPVQMAFFHRSSAADRVVAFYPSPMGATESRLELPVWDELERSNPLVRTIEDDVEALLVNRARGFPRRQWIVPIDDCYRLVAVVRTRWRGLTGGKEVWLAMNSFFDGLDQHARTDERR